MKEISAERLLMNILIDEKCLCNPNCKRKKGKAVVKHGSMFAYSRTKGHSCRCDECVSYVRELRSSRYWAESQKSGRSITPKNQRGTTTCTCHEGCEKRRLISAKNDLKHGAQLFKLHSCRCEICIASQKPCNCNPNCTINRPLKVVAHGTRHCYQNHSCRCSLCMDGNRQSALIARKARQQKLNSSESLIEELNINHGKYSTYSNWGCRCQPCTNAHVKKCAEYSRRRAEQTTLELESQVL